MTIKQAYRCINLERHPIFMTMDYPMFDIGFVYDGEVDETQLTIDEMGLTKKEIVQKLSELFKHFCEGEGIKDNTVISITYIGKDPHYNADS